MEYYEDTQSLIEVGAFDNLPLSKVEHEPSEKVRKYLKASTSEATLKAYKADIEHFTTWGGTIPATSQLIANYLASHADKLSVATLERRLAALSKVHKSLGDDNPVRKELVRTIMRGIKRSKGTAQRQVAPITKGRLLAMIATCDEGLQGLRDRALLLLGFSAALRRSELVAISYRHLEFVPEGVILHIPKSKTDQEGNGRKIGVPYARGDTCPVQALLNYLSAAHIQDGPVFRPSANHDKLAVTQLTSASVALIVKARASKAGFDPDQFSGHSLRAGFATSAAQTGVSYWAIAKQTGHKTQAAINRYVRDAELFRSNVLTKIF